MITLAKIVDVECPRCGLQTQLASGLIDVDTKQPVGMECPKCGFDFEFETLNAP